MMAHPPDDPHGGSLTPRSDPFDTPLGAALALTGEKCVVFPADHPDAGLACTGAGYQCVHGQCAAATDARARGKHPRVPRWGQLVGPADEGQLAEWFGEHVGPVNIAVACGPSGLLVVDDDAGDGFEEYCAWIGVEVPGTLRVRTHQGAHWYFTQPPGEPLGNAPGVLHHWGCDVRGAGGYVIAPGSTHWSGDRYVIIDDEAPILTAPDWLITAVQDSGPPAADGGGAGPREGITGAGGTRWTSDPRYGSPADLRAQYARHCAEVRLTAGGDPYRKALYRAARDGWRLVNLDLLDEDALRADMRRCIEHVWRGRPKEYQRDGAPAAADDPRDWKIVEKEGRLTGRDSAARSPWLIAGTSPRARDLHERSRQPDTLAEPVTSENGTPDAAATHTTQGNRTVADITDSDGLDMPVSIPEAPSLTGDPLLDGEVEIQRRRRLAREWLDNEGRAPLLRSSYLALKAMPRPKYLVPGMLYRDGLAVVFGEPSAGKSFLLLDIALALCSGKPWRGLVLQGRNGGRGVVHYVMAEGAATNGARMAAWAHRQECTDEDEAAIDQGFIPFLEPVMLTEAGVREYIIHVERDKPDVIIFDTKNLMFVGKESQGEDYGAMLRVLHAIRRAAGGCAVILVDHSGLGDKGRVRGSNAQNGGVDTEIVVMHDKESGLRLATMTRDKSAGLGVGEWCYRIVPVEDMPGLEEDEPTPAVCIPAERDGTRFIRPGMDWWLHAIPDETDDIVKAAKDPKDATKAADGKDAARDIVRLLRAVGTAGGHTPSEIIALLKEGPREHAKSKVYAGLAILARERITEEGVTPQRVALALRYMQ